MSVWVRFMQFYPKWMDGVVYLSHHSKNELSLNEPLKNTVASDESWHMFPKCRGRCVFYARLRCFLPEK